MTPAAANTTALQLTIDGREVPHAEVVRGPARARPLTPSQQDILRFAVMGRRGWIRSVEAGRIVHAHRRNTYHYVYQTRGIGCCKWAASDGNEACKRLARRGLLVRVEPGVWVTP